MRVWRSSAVKAIVTASVVQASWTLCGSTNERTKGMPPSAVTASAVAKDVFRSK